MNKNIHVNVLYELGSVKSHIFYPTKQHVIISDNNADKIKCYISVLNSTIDFISKLDTTLPIIIITNEVIITNILNERKNTNKNWTDILDKISLYKLQVKAYTSE